MINYIMNVVYINIHGALLIEVLVILVRNVILNAYLAHMHGKYQLEAKYMFRESTDIKSICHKELFNLIKYIKRSIKLLILIIHFLALFLYNS